MLCKDRCPKKLTIPCNGIHDYNKGLRLPSYKELKHESPQHFISKEVLIHD